MSDLAYTVCEHGHAWGCPTWGHSLHKAEARPLGTVADIDGWRLKAAAYDKAEKRCDSCGMPPEEVGDRCSFTGGRHWWVRVVPEIGDTE